MITYFYELQDGSYKCQCLTKVWDVDVFHEEEECLYASIKHCVENVEI